MNINEDYHDGKQSGKVKYSCDSESTYWCDWTDVYNRVYEWPMIFPVQKFISRNNLHVALNISLVAIVDIMIRSVDMRAQW